jgi:hypothetical protein
MDYGELIALSGIALGAAVTLLIVAGAWALGRQHERRNFLAATGGLEDTARRLERMERMIETLSTDVERLAESQRPPLRGSSRLTSGGM